MIPRGAVGRHESVDLKGLMQGDRETTTALRMEEPLLVAGGR
jgi:hypothetical protein